MFKRYLFVITAVSTFIVLISPNISLAVEHQINCAYYSDIDQFGVQSQYMYRDADSDWVYTYYFWGGNHSGCPEGPGCMPPGWEPACSYLNNSVNIGGDFHYFPGDEDQFASPPGNLGSCDLRVGNPVDPFTGHNEYREYDIGYPYPSMAAITRIYSSGIANIGAFGKGTASGYDYRLVTDSGYLRFIIPGGGLFYLHSDGSGGYINTNHHFLNNARAVLSPSKTLTFGSGTVFEFDSNGWLTEVEDPNGNYVTITRNSSGVMTAISDSFGRSLTITTTTKIVNSVTYTLLDEVEDAEGRIVDYAYNADATLESVEFPNNSKLRYTYSVDIINATYYTDDLGSPSEVLVSSHTYDVNGRVDQQTYADGGVLDIDYTLSGGTVTKVDVTTPSDAQTPGNIYSLDFNYAGYITGMSIRNTVGDPTGWETQFVRNSNAGNQFHKVSEHIESTDSYRDTWYSYNSYSLVDSVTDPAGNDTEFAYAKAAQSIYKPTDIIRHDGIQNVTASLDYDGSGNLTDIWRPGISNSVHITYDQYGLLNTITNEIDRTTTFIYNSSGVLESVTNHLGDSVSLEYDDIGRVTKMTNPRGKSTTYAYQNYGRDVVVTSPMGRTTTYKFNGRGQLVSVTDPKNQTRSYAYDTKGNPDTMTDQLSNSEDYTHDLRDRLTDVEAREGNEAELSYPDKKTFEIDYYDTSQSLEATVTYTNDSLGRITQVSDSEEGDIYFTYTDSSLGEYPDRVAMVNSPEGVISYTYDPLGRRATMSVTGQPTVHYTYTQAGLINSVWLDHQTWGLLEWEFTYNAAGQRTQLDYPNGIHTNYTYDSAGRLTEVNHDSERDSEIYTYDANGSLASVFREASSVPELGPPVLPTSTDATYDAANRITSLSGDTVAYDDNGNLTLWDTTVYEWDSRDRLAGISNAPWGSASFTYDALGRRSSKVINGTSWEYLYDGLDIVEETKGSRTCFFVRTPAIDEPLARICDDGTIYYYHQNALGSVLMLTGGTSKADKKVRTRYKYSQYGETVVMQGDGGYIVDQPFMFTGREWDGDMGMYFFRARYYSPVMKRFISEDPIGYSAGDVNFYRYVGNSPGNYVDPLGLCEILIFEFGNKSDTHNPYRALFVVHSDSGESAIVSGSSWPNPNNANPGVRSSEYAGIYGISIFQGGPGILLEGGAAISALGPNPNYEPSPNAELTDEIFIHSGHSDTWRGSAGCFTIDPAEVQQVWDILSDGEQCTIILNRSIE